MKNSTIIALTVIIFGLIVAGAMLIDRGQFILNENRLLEPERDPIDVVDQFAGAWLTNLQATSSLSVADFLSTQTEVTESLRASFSVDQATELDPILCQPVTPERVGIKPVYVTDTSAQVMVIPRGVEKTPNQSVVTLDLADDVWLISDINCSFGEMGPEVGEFTFEQTGRLAKSSLPERYDSELWHVLFTDESDVTQIVPLFFDELSQCERDGVAATCTPADFVEGTVVLVQADMTEAGATVRQMELE